MATPDPTLAARLATAKMRYNATETGYAKDELRMIAGNAYLADQLITLADAEAMVRAENEACALAVQSRSDFYAEKRNTAHDCDREMLMGDIIVAHDHAIDAIRARVKPHNNEVA
jgi:hypothetical protein